MEEWTTHVQQKWLKNNFTNSIGDNLYNLGIQQHNRENKYNINQVQVEQKAIYTGS